MKNNYKVGDLIWDDGDGSFGVLIRFIEYEGFQVYWFNPTSKFLKANPKTTEPLWNLKNLYRKVA